MAATSTDALARLEATLALGQSAPTRRMLIIVNPYATTVSDRLKNLVVYALRGSYEVDAIDTERRNHATDLRRQAAPAKVLSRPRHRPLLPLRRRRRPRRERGRARRRPPAPEGAIRRVVLHLGG